MAKAKTLIKKPEPEPKAKAEYLPWPTTPKELSLTPRLFRIHRMNAFEWQAYVTDQGTEYPIGKPDLFDILKAKVAGVIKAEGQAEFMAAKLKSETPNNVQ